MAKLKLIADPVFKLEVAIPAAGKPSVPVEFEFKHLTKTAWVALMTDGSLKEKTDVWLLLQIVKSWEFEEELSEANVQVFLDNYGGAMEAINNAYIAELRRAKEKN